MKYLLRFSILIMAFCLINHTSLSQVSKIKENVENDDKNSSSKTESSTSISDSEDMSFGESILAEIFFGIIKGISIITVEAQKQVLSDLDKHPNLISVETGIDYGTDFNTLIFNPSLRVNWGIFASDMRYSLIHDYSGSLCTFDWQMAVLRIPIDKIKLNYGIGFTSLSDPPATYFESSIGVDAHLYNNKLNLISCYRWTQKKTEERFRQEFKMTADFQLLNNKNIKLSPMIGITYQNYFKEDEFLMFNIGIKIRFSGD
ncbi:hypothetical protein [Carboxylicivirga marina]|uniref:Outer membrane protein beta-barrel domain-containing protein n=1 Tax=Carboxylicivirga marina TaxID=2800988 RepID=A0ABS1HQM4_9BACT|nr:hypothetical protein [Carboxylicivirga marina]MBK3519972.1 hypothetical protein [Carboxylicivirga marina]